MKKIILIAIVSVLSGCYGAQIEQLRRENAELKQRDLQWRRQNARRDGYQPPGAPQLPSERPAPPAAGSPMAGMGGQSATGTMWAYQKHGPYMCAVGTQARQVTKGRKIHVQNIVCDKGYGGFQCGDSDDLDELPEYNTWLAFELNGEPVLCDGGFQHQLNGETVLKPLDEAFIEVSHGGTYKLTVKAYRNNGTSSISSRSFVLDLDNEAFNVTTHRIPVENGTVKFPIDEVRLR